VYRVLQRYEETGTYTRRTGQGRKRKRRDEKITFCLYKLEESLRNDLQLTTGAVISSRTVLRRLRESNLTPRRPGTGPRLNPGYRMARLNFAREHRNWHREWHNVLFY
jgi:transposase